MKFNIILPAIVFVMFSGVLTFAQTEAPTIKKHGDMTSELKEKLSLTDEQEVTVKEIFTSYKEKMQSLKSQKDGDREAMMGERNQLMAEMDKEIAGVLTEDQYKLYESLMAERRGKMNDHKPMNGQKPMDN